MSGKKLRSWYSKIYVLYFCPPVQISSIMAHWREHLYQSPRKVADTIREAVHGWRKLNIHTESHWFICITWFSTGICTRSTDKDLFTAGRKHHYSWYGFTYWSFQVCTIHMIQQVTMRSTLHLSSGSHQAVCTPLFCRTWKIIQAFLHWTTI